jgi:hypothetical protein
VIPFIVVVHWPGDEPCETSRVEARPSSVAYFDVEPERAPGFAAWAERQNWLENQRKNFRGELARLQSNYEIWRAQRSASHRAPPARDISREWDADLHKQAAENAAKEGRPPWMGVARELEFEMEAEALDNEAEKRAARKLTPCPHCGGSFMRHDSACPRDRNSGRACACGAELEEPGSRYAHQCPRRSAHRSEGECWHCAGQVGEHASDCRCAVEGGRG